MALVSIADGVLHHIHGCKPCVGGLSDLGWIEISEALHPERLLAWNGHVEQLASDWPEATGFERDRGVFVRRVLQRSFPSNWGRWAGL